MGMDMAEYLENGEEITLHEGNFIITIDCGSEGYNGNLYLSKEDLENEEVFDGGICDGTAEDAIEFFIDLAREHSERISNES